jgi:hypothetical protein
MTTSPHDPLIRGLAADLKPVRRLPRPMLRALGWLGLVAAIALGLAVFATCMLYGSASSPHLTCGLPYSARLQRQFSPPLLPSN